MVQPQSLARAKSSAGVGIVTGSSGAFSFGLGAVLMIERALAVDIAMLCSPPVGAIGQEAEAVFLAGTLKLRHDA
jgi:hypothetical protein